MPSSSSNAGFSSRGTIASYWNASVATDLLPRRRTEGEHNGRSPSSRSPWRGVRLPPRADSLRAAPAGQDAREEPASPSGQERDARLHLHGHRLARRRPVPHLVVGEDRGLRGPLERSLGPCLDHGPLRITRLAMSLPP